MPVVGQSLLSGKLLLGLLFTAGWVLQGEEAIASKADYKGMVLIPGGSFQMGGDPGLMGGGSQSHNTSYPVHEVFVDAFWMDKKEITNQQFADFVEATGYVTFSERPLSEDSIRALRSAGNRRIQELELILNHVTGQDREAVLDLIKRITEAMQFGESAGAIVFLEPEDALYGTQDYTQWWRIRPGASWRCPDGPGSTWLGREDHPVVNVTQEDAAAYAAWAGKRLPTEAEWERAARGGLERAPYVWGKNFSPNGKGVWMANIWQGVWPYENTAEDGFVATAPVGSFPSNAYGLYDMAGNVWEIVADRYHPNTYKMRVGRTVINPVGPDLKGLGVPESAGPVFVTRGGSFLCSDSWCRGYQPGSRQSFENDSPSNHTGFRCVKEVEPAVPDDTSSD